MMTEKQKENLVQYFITIITRFYPMIHFGYPQRLKKFLLVGTLQWKEYVHMDYLKIYIQKISYGYSIPILTTLVIIAREKSTDLILKKINSIKSKDIPIY